MEPKTCVYCGRTCESHAGNPGLWPIRFAHYDGVVVTHCTDCIALRCEAYDKRQPAEFKRYMSADVPSGNAATAEVPQHLDHYPDAGVCE